MFSIFYVGYFNYVLVISIHSGPNTNGVFLIAVYPKSIRKLCHLPWFFIVHNTSIIQIIIIQGNNLLFYLILIPKEIKAFKYFAAQCFPSSSIASISKWTKSDSQSFLSVFFKDATLCCQQPLVICVVYRRKEYMSSGFTDRRCIKTDKTLYHVNMSPCYLSN